jgi:hypothetical protein
MTTRRLGAGREAGWNGAARLMVPVTRIGASRLRNFGA